MKIHTLMHAPFEGLGHIQRWIDAKGHAATFTHVYADQPYPDPSEPDMFIIMGGPMGVNDEDKLPWLAPEKRFIEKAVAAGKKCLGICLGAQLLACVLGAPVKKNRVDEIGWHPVSLTPDGSRCRVFSGFGDSFTVLQWHGDTFDIPRGALHLAKSEACANQGFLYDDRILGLQFHLECTREAVEGIVQNCGGDLDIGGDFIQSADEILHAKERFEDNNRKMESVLDHF